jgi:1-deoxy-D-xylulose-5-phosphate synthase
MQAAKLLQEKGIDCSIVNARFAKPIDREMIRWAAENHRILLSVEEGTRLGGFGSAVNETLVEMGIPMQCHILGAPDDFIEHGEQAWQQEQAGLSPQQIMQTVCALLENAGNESSVLVAPLKDGASVKTR